jgi:aldehyde:ferredoxin oxidoreductase
LVENIAYREGIGDTLAEGTHRVHEELGVDDWTVKGMEFPAHDGRTLNGQGLSFAVANRGADHMYATFYAWEYPLVAKEEAFPPEGLTPEKVEAVVKQENTRALEDCGIVCRFSRDVMTEARFEAFFGEDIGTLREVGAKTIELERAFNNERGFDSADDTLPYELPDFEAMRSRYYDLRGWTDNGRVDTDAGSTALADD